VEVTEKEVAPEELIEESGGREVDGPVPKMS